MNNIFIIYLFLINIFGLLLMFIDKQKAKRHKWRISENTLILISILGGSIGSIIGMQLFRHKTKHVKFKLGLPIILIMQIILLCIF
ncbi:MULTISPECIES: DUF1294 domain-containing protein [Clostridium]|uniref:DUF1294 domain-containing protein n=2 Tax=Clostridium TaxID=1485 RepID=A0ABP3WUE2_9CLOT|nr:DUF1294 domain-containing protein [Clostridium baratii]MBS6041202.1 DUF1294 domain-containing protein [Clostridium baratii]MBT9830576.1 DUF1294 domain-containing protein [Clostridium baratii]MDY3206695.1 DUF1294 domain-containing protein [Clostridium baratii]STA98670.1 phosphoesterase [Clostridium baratii]